MVEPIDNISIGDLEKGCYFGENELIIKMGDMEMTTIRRDSTQVRECLCRFLPGPFLTPSIVLRMIRKPLIGLHSKPLLI